MAVNLSPHLRSAHYVYPKCNNPAPDGSRHSRGRQPPPGVSKGELNIASAASAPYHAARRGRPVRQS